MIIPFPYYRRKVHHCKNMCKVDNHAHLQIKKSVSLPIRSKDRNNAYSLEMQK